MKKKISILIILIIILVGFVSIFIFSNSDKEKSTNLVKLSTETFKKKIDNKESFILLITREGCSHCQEYLPVFINVLEKHKLTAYSLDLQDMGKEDREYLASVANISGTPTTVFIDKGEEKTVLNRIVGSANRKTIETRLKTMKYIK